MWKIASRVFKCCCNFYFQITQVEVVSAIYIYIYGHKEKMIKTEYTETQYWVTASG